MRSPDPKRIQPTEYRIGRQGFRHEGDCGVREFCWRPECVEQFPGYRTIERWPDTGDIIARCHHSTFNVLGMTVREAA